MLFKMIYVHINLLKPIYIELSALKYVGTEIFMILTSNGKNLTFFIVKICLFRHFYC